LVWYGISYKKEIILYPKVILIRHGETIWNREERFQGHLDSTLTEKGEEQAIENGKKVKKVLDRLDSIKLFSSPLGRAKSTALIVASEIGISSKDIIFEDRIKEFNYGILEGKTREYCNKNHYQIMEAREADKWFYRVENGDSYELVVKRVKSWLDSLDSNQTIIAVTHEMVNRALRKIYRGISVDEALMLRQPNSVVLLLENSEEKILT